jgi:7-cyano-7-deazaguanine synthase
VEEGILVDYQTVDLRVLQSLLGDSVLTDHEREVPDGHYAEESMKATVVPNRNMIMLAIATGYAVTMKATQGIWTGVHGGDHFIYPDCRPVFINSLSSACFWGNNGMIDWEQPDPIHAPFLHIAKHDIAAIGRDLGVDFRKTWSCYKGNPIHCGRCGTCVERKEAFRLSQVMDYTEYEDPDFEIKAYRGE